MTDDKLVNRYKVDFKLKISDEAFSYLKLHRGSIEHLARHRGHWEQAYRAGLEKSYLGMMYYLPIECSSILDIGAGLGGIDIILSRHYGGTPKITLLDGEADAPKMELHRKTFGHREVARRFHKDNGQANFDYVSPQTELTPRPVDLTISTGAWCFHFPPEEYLDFVMKCMRPGGVLITDVRKDKPQWLETLSKKLVFAGTIAEQKKRDRLVFYAPS